MGRRFKDEIENIPLTIQWATKQEVKSLLRTLTNASSKPLLAIGSGGSFTVAVFAASCHEKRFGQLSRAVTPLDYIGTGYEVRDAAVLMLSAEGKNNDILSAARSALTFEHVAFALVLKSQSPLCQLAMSSGAMSIIEYDMPWDKDGYLATNSLVAMIVLLAKAYDRDQQRDFTAALSHITLDWIGTRRNTISTVIRKYSVGNQVLVLYGSKSRSTAIDVESKFAESTLGTCQLADYRQFAHGRHLQLSHVTDAIVIAFVDDEDRALAETTLALLPRHIRQLVLDVPENAEVAAVQGAIDAMLITDVVADIVEVDPGQPYVPEYCRLIHHLDLSVFLKDRPLAFPVALGRKLKRAIPDRITLDRLSAARSDFTQRLGQADIKVLICDFDGTFCETDRRYDGLDGLLLDEIERITGCGVPIVFATGRGDSLLGDLRAKVPRTNWGRIYLGYYSGSVIACLDETPVFPESDPRFEDLLSWLDTMGVNALIEAKPKRDCGQLGLRCGNNASRHEAVSAIKFWIQQNKLWTWRVYCSGHSIDVLTEAVGKQNVVDFAVEAFNVNPQTEILRLGDSGDFEGNDFELLCSGLGLSVGSVSPDPNSCWNLLPTKCRGVVGTKYYLSHLQIVSGYDGLSMASLFSSAFSEGQKT